jgi:hypothetical protein
MNNETPRIEEKLSKTPSGPTVRPSPSTLIERLRLLDFAKQPKTKSTHHGESQLLITRKLHRTAGGDSSDSSDTSCASTPVLENRSTLPTLKISPPETTLAGRLRIANYLRLATLTPPKPSRLISTRHTLLGYNIRHAKEMLTHLENNAGQLTPKQKRVRFIDTHPQPTHNNQLQESTLSMPENNTPPSISRA